MFFDITFAVVKATIFWSNRWHLQNKWIRCAVAPCFARDQQVPALCNMTYLRGLNMAGISIVNICEYELYGI